MISQTAVKSASQVAIGDNNIYLIIIQNNDQASLATTIIANRLEVILISTTTLATIARLITTIITHTLYRVQQEMSIIGIRCGIQIMEQWIERLKDAFFNIN